MSLLDTIRENARQVATGDDWYYKAGSYILELRTVANPAKTGIMGTSAYLTFPLSPEEYRVSRVFRQSVTPTMGGLVAEERGLLWWDITIQGTFGLTPKGAIDTTLYPVLSTDAGPIPGTLSGPEWTRRLVRNFFEKYGALKADPDTASETRLIWHDMKTDDHWVVVPKQIDIDRTKARRTLYPFVIQFQGIARADALVIPAPPASLKGFGKAGAVIESVKKGIALVSAGLQECSEIQGEIRREAASIDDVVDNVTLVVNSAQDFVDGSTSTILIGRSFIESTTQALQSVVNLLEAATNVPRVVYQSYMMALDGLDAIASQLAAYGRTYEDETDWLGRVEAGANSDSQTVLSSAADTGPAPSSEELSQRRERSSDEALVLAGALPTGRTFGSYAGFRSYTVRTGDTLQSIAAQQMGDGSLWYDLAIVNGLSAPYITPYGAPRTVKPGDTISIPTAAAQAVSAVVAGSGSEPGEELLGVDLALEETPLSNPARPVVDLAIDRSSYKDAKLIRGFGNLAQALQLRVWTEQGSMPLLPLYGFPTYIGGKQTETFFTLLRLNLRQTFKQDSRVQTVSSLKVEISGDAAEVSADIVPVGAETARTVSAAIS